MHCQTDVNRCCLPEFRSDLSPNPRTLPIRSRSRRSRCKAYSIMRSLEVAVVLCKLDPRAKLDLVEHGFKSWIVQPLALAFDDLDQLLEPILRQTAGQEANPNFVKQVQHRRGSPHGPLATARAFGYALKRHQRIDRPNSLCGFGAGCLARALRVRSLA